MTQLSASFPQPKSVRILAGHCMSQASRQVNVYCQVGQGARRVHRGRRRGCTRDVEDREDAWKVLLRSGMWGAVWIEESAWECVNGSMISEWLGKYVIGRNSMTCQLLHWLYGKASRKVAKSGEDVILGCFSTSRSGNRLPNAQIMITWPQGHRGHSKDQA